MELILSVCLLASPGVCKEEALSLAGEQTRLASQCLVSAPVVIAEWADGHPKWKVVKWRCGAAHDKVKDI